MSSSLERSPLRTAARRALLALLTVALLWTPGRVQAGGMDVNDDGVFNIFDALAVIYCILDLGVCTDMDFNQDSNINILDAIMMMYCVVETGPCLTLTPGSCLTNDDCVLGEMCHVPTKKCVIPALVGAMGTAGHSASSEPGGFSIDGLLSAGHPAGSATSANYTLTGIVPQ